MKLIRQLTLDQISKNAESSKLTPENLASPAPDARRAESYLAKYRETRHFDFDIEALLAIEEWSR